MDAGILASRLYALSWIPLMPNTGVMGHTVDACMEEARHACFGRSGALDFT